MSPTLHPDPRALRGTLYSPRHEHDACGIGFIADLTGTPSRAVVERALDAACNLAHRGGTNADALTGDGAGIMTQLPHGLLARALADHGVRAPLPGRLAVGMVFLAREPAAAAAACAGIDRALAAAGCSVLAWRDVPTDATAIGRIAAASRPTVRQVLLVGDDAWDGDEFERRLFRARRSIEHDGAAAGLHACICSLSARTIVYKGMLVADQLRGFYPDLADREFTTAVAMFHQRFSTNTFPSWERAQPYRMLAHNGEINTLHGNVQWLRAREPQLQSPLLDDAFPSPVPVIDEQGSDSGMLDNVLELLVRGGRDVRHAISMLVPPAWERLSGLDPDQRAFHDYHAAHMEPWDGPAALAFFDGRWIGAALDRNGLRPVRYLVTGDGMVVCSSEAGVADVIDSTILVKGKLGPGQMLALDTSTGRLHGDAEIRAELATLSPWREWLEQGRSAVEVDPGTAPPPSRAVSADDLPRIQASFGYTREELNVVLRPMVQGAAEPIGSMGDDTGQTVLAARARPLSSLFQQRFAEVTNPPIDPMREALVMSLTTLLGARGNLLAATAEHAELIRTRSPVLVEATLDALRLDAAARGWHVADVSLLAEPSRLTADVAALLDDVCAAVEAEVRSGARIVVLDDHGADPQLSPIPALLAVGAVHHHLVRCGLRMHASLVVSSGEPREVHDMATLIGFGANAVCPWGALASVRAIAAEARVQTAGIDAAQAARRYVAALESGLLKVMARMGIATVDSYCGAQVFECVGLAAEVIERCFAGTPSQLGGMGFPTIGAQAAQRHRDAWSEPSQAPALASPGYYKYRRDGDHHAFSPATVKALHRAVLGDGEVGEDVDGIVERGAERYAEFSRLLHDGPPSDLRDLLEFAPPGGADAAASAVALDEVEPVERIVERFSTGAMSLGSLSPEAHETLAIAMNRLGAMSNSGEGGEDRARFGGERNSAIKQVASGRFGVTTEYLLSARELQIKMAQGSKPGEGGQLPGDKVTGDIARIRHTTPGVTLISPPPHHDIYSIEDLAQLIHDLKQTSPAARVSVKLVAQAGVGTIAAGVAKAHADGILISGHSGGTGASPLGSIKHAGLPWELGLAETQQTLVANGLRGRIRLRADGGLRTGRDVLVAALLGADEFSFGTAALVAEGCLMARTCHNNQCPVGIATQRADLRAKYAGSPERVMAYMLFVAHEVRALLAELGLRSVHEAVGRTDLLRERAAAAQFGLTLSPLLARSDVPAGWHRRAARNPRPASVAGVLNELIVRDFAPALEHGRRLPGPLHRTYAIRNTDRTAGARLAGALAEQFGHDGLPADVLHLAFRGSAGQSFGAFAVRGMRLVLEGEANDYVAKGLSGGTVVVHPPRGSMARAAGAHHIAGNTVLYGATAGRLFLAGRVGERFAVRNSGADAVVEGLGDHGCEYMTGGTVVVIGSVGRNFAAGMTGGAAYVIDDDGTLDIGCNQQLVTIGVPDPADLVRVQELLAAHAELTGSTHAAHLLAEWPATAERLRRVAPCRTRTPVGDPPADVASTTAPGGSTHPPG